MATKQPERAAEPAAPATSAPTPEPSVPEPSQGGSYTRDPLTHELRRNAPLADQPTEAPPLQE